MPITQNGLQSRRYQDIVNSINQDLVNNLASDINTSPETVIGIITAIFSDALTDQEELVQGVFDAFNVDKAEGKFLDDLVALVGLSRLGQAPSSGLLDVRGLEGTLIPEGSEFRDINNNNILASSNVLITQDNCISVSATPNGVATATAGTVYSVTVGNFNASYTIVGGETAEQVNEALKDILDDNPEIVTTLLDDQITITPSTSGASISVQFNALFTILEVTAQVPAENSIVGPTQILSGEVSIPPADVSGIVSVNNPLDFNTGRFIETDEQLRARQQASFSLAGNTTLTAIVSKLRQLSGVTSVSIVENATGLPSPTNGLPPNSYECIVVGGSDAQVGQTIFESKPAGIRTVGNTSVVIPFEGEDYQVNFSRPEPVFLYLRVEYTKYSEEEFPIDGDAAIRQALVDHVQSLPAGKDFIPKRSYSEVYEQVPGINELTVKAFSSNDPSLLPTTTSFTENRIPVGIKGFFDLAVDRVVTIDLTGV